MMPPRSALLGSLALASLTLFAGEVSFTKQTITNEFVAEGCTVADFDHDGHLDIAAGPYIWYGPDFKRRSNYTPMPEHASGMSKTPYNPATGYSDFFIMHSHDFNGDGWPDLLVYGLPGEPAYLYLNPQGKGGDWARHNIFDIADGESPSLIDMNRDGKPELLVHTSDAKKTAENKGGGQLGFAEIDWKNPTAKARFHAITAKSPENGAKYFKYTHGYGAGDVNGDGRLDLLTKDGWFEQPADLSKHEPWVFHPAHFGDGGAQMYVLDVNGDGRNDVITSYKAHGYGLGWFEQNADGSFTEHKIMGATAAENPQGVVFSQIHAMQIADINGDGLPDIICGKRHWAHGNKGDAEPNAEPVLYWFELKRDGKGGANFIPHLIDNDSGVGTQFWTGDINGDGKIDIVIANKKGVFVFTQK